MFSITFTSYFTVRSVSSYKNKNKSSLLIICLYVIGLTMAQMIVEVAPRYHYSATIPMIFLAAFGIKHIYNKKNINKSVSSVLHRAYAFIWPFF